MTKRDIRPPFIDPRADALLSRMGADRAVLFLDRDGVINVNHGYVHTPATTEWVPGVFELVGAAHAHGIPTIVVTNQAGIGRGLYDEASFLDYTSWIHREFESRDAPLLATYWCPHHPTGGQGDYRIACDCRKPAAGMLLAAIDRFGIDGGRSFLVGDSPTDIEAAHAAGIGSAHLLREQEWGSSFAALIERLGRKARPA